MSQPITSSLKALFMCGLTWSPLSTIVIQAQQVLPFLEEVPQLKAKIIDKADSHWAFQPIRKLALPEVKQKSWVKNPIDLFILRKLKTVSRDAEATIHSMPKDGTYVSERRETALPKRPSRN